MGSLLNLLIEVSEQAVWRAAYWDTEILVTENFFQTKRVLMVASKHGTACCSIITHNLRLCCRDLKPMSCKVVPRGSHQLIKGQFRSPEKQNIICEEYHRNIHIFKIYAKLQILKLGAKITHINAEQ